MHTHPTADCVCRPRHLCAPAKPGAAQIPQALPRLLCPAGTHDGGGPCGLLAALLRDGRSCMPGDGRLRGCLRAGCACLPATCLVAVPPAPPALLLLMPTSRPSPTARLQVYPERMAALPPRVFQTLLSTLQFGVGATTGDEEVTQVGVPTRHSWLSLFFQHRRSSLDFAVAPSISQPSLCCREAAPPGSFGLHPRLPGSALPHPLRRLCSRRRLPWRAFMCSQWLLAAPAWAPTMLPQLLPPTAVVEGPPPRWVPCCKPPCSA